MTAIDIVNELKPLGKESYKKVLLNHGINEPFFGVKIEELKKIQKRIRKDYQLAKDLYETGIYDAMYLAGLIADEEKMTKQDLRRWLKTAGNASLCGFTVPWVASESKHGLELAREWIDSKEEKTASAGWATFSSLVAIKDDAELDLDELKKLLGRVEKTIHKEANSTKYVMNSFVIAVGSYVKPLSSFAMQTAKRIGAVACDMVGDCKVPFAPDYIKNVQERGTVGKKRMSAKC